MLIVLALLFVTLNGVIFLTLLITILFTLVSSKTAFSKAGTEVMLKIRNKMQKAEVSKMPFVEARYYRVPE